MTNSHFLCVHGHFYQPARGNPFADDDVGLEPGAEPYQNYNEKILAECYAPNGAIGNYELISFNVGSTLARWLEAKAPEVYAQMLAADKTHLEKYSVGNALAQPVHHSILPLLRNRDIILQVRWGLISFEHRFKRPAEGMWLPEMAVDHWTLQVLHDNGIKFTILSQGQVKGAEDGAGPYWIRLPSGDRIAVYVRDDWHSNQLSFNIQTLGGAGRWARHTLMPLKKNYGRLLLLATNGETFGYHHPGEEHFLHWLLSYEAFSVGYEMTTLARDLRENPPTQEVELIEYTAWSCKHGLARWNIGCECTAGDSRWKGALRRALDNLAGQLDDVYEDYAKALGVEPWALRDQYFRVWLGQITPEQFLQNAGLGGVTTDKSQALMTLLLSQFHRQRMYMSSAFYYDDLDRTEPRYAVANAARAMATVTQVTQTDFTLDFRRDLAQAIAANGKTGEDILDEVLAVAHPSSETTAVVEKGEEKEN